MPKERYGCGSCSTAMILDLLHRQCLLDKEKNEKELWDTEEPIPERKGVLNPIENIPMERKESGMKYCGIEAATVAWKPLGWKPIAFCEIDTFPSALLAYHYPHITKVDWSEYKQGEKHPDMALPVFLREY